MFPLPLVAFERYMLADDRLHEPMAFQIRLVWQGTLDPQQLRTALAEAVARHPLLGARLSGRSRYDLHWIAGDDTLHFDCQPWGTPLEHPDVASIDLRREPGLRTWVRYDAERTEVRFHFHHACADGIGAYRFIDEVFSRYHNLCRPQQAVPLRSVRAELLKQRTRMGCSRWRRLLRLPLTLIACMASPLENWLAPPRPIALPPFERPGPDELRRVVDMPAEQLTSDEVRRLAQLAKQRRVSLNDLLLRDTFLAVRDWHEQQTGARLEGRLGLAIPFNLRSPEDDEQSCTNIVGIAPINLGPRLLDKPARLLSFVSNVMTYYKRFGLAIEFPHVIAVLEQLLGGLNLFLRADHCSASATFSNVGRVFSDSPLPRTGERLQAGDLTLLAVESAPPIRPLTWVSFSTLSYGGELTVIGNYDRLAMSETTAREIVGAVVKQLRATAAEPSGEQPAR